MSDSKHNTPTAPTVTLVTNPHRPTDCVRPQSCSGAIIRIVGGGVFSSCGLAGCQHNHNPSHGGCGTDLRSTWEHTRHER